MAKDMMQIYTYTDENGFRCFQRAKYIEDGWFIREVDSSFEVYEIPQYGGEEYHHNTCDTFDEALKSALNFG